MTAAHHYHSLKSLLNHPGFHEGENWHKKTFEAEELVILEGENGHEIYAILSGKVSVCTQVQISESRNMLSGLCELFDGEEFAHSCFFDDEPHSASVKTITSCELAVIDAAKLKIFLQDHPEIGFNLLYYWITMMLPRIRQGNKRFASLFSWGLKAHQLDVSL
jgi:CRP/FNR family transcriptional regulator, cyclic AMP receptor protein